MPKQVSPSFYLQVIGNCITYFYLIRQSHRIKKQIFSQIFLDQAEFCQKMSTKNSCLLFWVFIFPLTFPHFLRNDDDFFPWYIKMDLFLSQFLSSSHFLRNVDAIFSWCIEMHLFLSFDLSSVVKVRSQKIQTCSEKFLTITVVFHILLSSSLCLCENQQHVTESFIQNSRNLDWEERVRRKNPFRCVGNSAPY